MKAAEGKLGRTFVLRFEDGEKLPGVLEQFCAENDVRAAMVILLGGIKGGTIVVGPKETAIPPEPVTHLLQGAHEVAAVGTVFWDSKGPSLHLHGALGRGDKAVTGCTRTGVEVYLVAEAVVLEIVGVSSRRAPDPLSGFDLLEP